MGYAQGFQQGRETVKDKNPFAVLLNTIDERFAERRALDKKKAEEERELRNEVFKLGVQDTYARTLAKEKMLGEGITKGDITETEETGEGTFEGTPFGAVGKRYKTIKKETPVYLVDPITGETRQVATTPKGAKTVRGQAPTTEKIQMGTYLDSMEESIDAMEDKLKDPNIMLRGLINPLGEREFKAILASFDKEAAIAAGGKQLTKTELDLIRSTRPTIWDIKSPEAIARKIKKLRSIVTGAQSRLGAGGGVSAQGKSGGQIMVDSNGNKAMVYPDGSFEEIK